MIFKNRTEAGRQLAETLVSRFKFESPGVVLALPRGGVVLGYEVVKRLKWPLSLIITRKISHPLSPEYAIGAVTESGAFIGNEKELARVDKLWLETVINQERKEATRRRKLYLANVEPVSPIGKIAVIVDDGVATGLTVMLALQEIKAKNPKKIILALPVVRVDFAEKIEGQGITLVALIVPKNYLGAVGAYYENFDQVSDETVIKLLKLD